MGEGEDEREPRPPLASVALPSRDRQRRRDFEDISSSSTIISGSPAGGRRRVRAHKQSPPPPEGGDGGGVRSRASSSGCLADLCEAPPDPAGGDEASSIRLAALGYKQELYRGVDAVMSLAIDVSCFSAITSISVLYRFSLTLGGPPVMVWSWIVTWAMTLVCSLVMGEICSTYPLAGSVYSWAGELCSVEWAPFCSFWAGWFNLLGYISGVACFAYIFADTLSASEGVDFVGREFTEPELVAVALGVLAVWGGLNLLRVDYQGWLNNFGALWQLATTLAIVGAILAYPPPEHRNTAEAVFGGAENRSGFSDRYMPYVCLLGMLPALYGFSGYDASSHMSEETQHASTTAPRNMVLTILLSGAVGLVYILGLLFSTADIDAVLRGPTNAAIATYVIACGPKVGRVLARLLVSNVFFAGLAQLTVTSRTAFAMARDRAFPGWKWLRKVDPHMKEPLRLLATCLLLDALLLLLALVTPVAFYSITSLSTIGLQVSYAIPLLQRATVARWSFQRSEFHLGALSVPLAAVGFVWLALTSLLFLLPMTYPIDPVDFNYTPVMVGGVVVLGSVYWFAKARASFVGPSRLPYEVEEEEEGEEQEDGKEGRRCEEEEEEDEDERVERADSEETKVMESGLPRAPLEKQATVRL